MIREFAKGVIKELDYRNEAYHAMRIAESMQRFPEIHIPVVDPERSSARVLTAEFVKGIKISDVERLRAAGMDTTHLGSVFIRALIKQVLVDGFFHGDPHPGNVLVDPETGQIVFLDFGLVGELRSDQRLTLIQLLYALKSADSGGIADALIGLGTPGPGFEDRLFRADVDRLTRQYLIYSKADSVGAAISAVLGAVFDNGLRLDNDLTLAIKAVVQAEETAMILEFDVDIATAAFEEARAATMERITPEAIQKIAMSQAVRAGQEFARRLPTLELAVWKWMDQFGKGKLVVEIDTSELNKEIAKVSDLGRQVAVGMLVTGQLIGTAILAVVLLQPAALDEFQTFAYVGLIAFGVSLIVSMYVLVRALRTPESESTATTTERAPMKPIRGLIDFYKLQAEILWKWRPGRRALLRRMIVSFIVAFLSLTLTVGVIPGLIVDSWATMVLAVIAFALINALIRPVILFALASISTIAVIVATFVFQILVFYLVEWLLPGFTHRAHHRRALRIDRLRGLQHDPRGDLLGEPERVVLRRRSSPSWRAAARTASRPTCRAS